MHTLRYSIKFISLLVNYGGLKGSRPFRLLNPRRGRIPSLVSVSVFLPSGYWDFGLAVEGDGDDGR